VISDPLIRNRATLGGSLAEASPRGDWPAVALAAAATLQLRSRDGERAVPAGDFFTTDGTGPGGKATTLRRGELLTVVTVPAAGPLTRSAYLKRMHPASGHAMIGVAAAATFDTSETCIQCRIAITGVSAIATRAARTEEHLTGSRLTASTGQTRQKPSTNIPRATLRLGPRSMGAASVVTLSAGTANAGGSSSL
jgi:carbon-monoxide dehydrogenase medium subunit